MSQYLGTLGIQFAVVGKSQVKKRRHRYVLTKVGLQSQTRDPENKASCTFEPIEKTYLSGNKTGPEVIKMLSCSTQQEKFHAQLS